MAATLPKHPVLVALDMDDLARARALVRDVRPYIGGIKLGMEFYYTFGAAALDAFVADGLPVFLDLKVHDIPATVEKACAALAQHGVAMTTIHLSGGGAMIRAALEGAKAGADRAGVPAPLLLGVSVLTSTDAQEFRNTGGTGTIADQVTRLVRLGVDNGLRGIVCAPEDIQALRQHVGTPVTIVTPGIRPAGSAAHDQKRIATPVEAMAWGADYLVIGRPITAVENPAAAARAIAESIAGAGGGRLANSNQNG